MTRASVVATVGAMGVVWLAGLSAGDARAQVQSGGKPREPAATGPSVPQGPQAKRPKPQPLTPEARRDAPAEGRDGQLPGQSVPNGGCRYREQSLDLLV